MGGSLRRLWVVPLFGGLRHLSAIRGVRLYSPWGVEACHSIPITLVGTTSLFSFQKVSILMGMIVTLFL